MADTRLRGVIGRLPETARGACTNPPLALDGNCPPALSRTPCRLPRPMRTRSSSEGSRRLRVLFLGPVGGFHVEPMARAVHERGHDVIVGGPAWAGGDTSLALTGGDIPVSLRTW